MWRNTTLLVLLALAQICVTESARTTKRAGSISKRTGSAAKLQMDPSLSTPELMTQHGYEVEVHTATTPNLYLLEMHRLPNPGKPVVIIQHGFLGTSADWVLLGPNKALAYLAFDSGYDVWLTNARGNRYSKQHKIMSNSDTNYWQFSWHEMGVYDLMTEINYILGNTSQPQVNYIGHSMGTLKFWVLLAMRPKYNDKVRQMHALAPLAFVGGKDNAFNAVNQFLSKSSKSAELGEFLDAASLSKLLAKSCTEPKDLQGACANLFYLLFLQGSTQINATMFPTLLSHVPDGTSTKNLQHFTEQLDTGKFCMFDYGEKENLGRYHMTGAPEYQLHRISVPVHMHYAAADTVVAPVDVEKLCTNIASCKSKRLVPLDTFQHGDFVFGKDARTLVYEEIISKLSKSD